MERNCGTCKHRGDEPIESPFGRTAPTTFYECKRVNHDDGKDFKRGAQAVVVDASDYFAALCVEDSFSCCLWESKS